MRFAFSVRKNSPSGLYSINHLADGQYFLLASYSISSPPQWTAFRNRAITRNCFCGLQDEHGGSQRFLVHGLNGRLVLETYPFVSLQANGRKMWKKERITH